MCVLGGCPTGTLLPLSPSPCEGRFETVGDPGPRVGPWAFWPEGGLACSAGVVGLSCPPPPPGLSRPALQLLLHPLWVLPASCFCTWSLRVAPGCVCRLRATVQSVRSVSQYPVTCVPEPATGSAPGLCPGPLACLCPFLGHVLAACCARCSGSPACSLRWPWNQPSLQGARFFSEPCGTGPVLRRGAVNPDLKPMQPSSLLWGRGCLHTGPRGWRGPPSWLWPSFCGAWAGGSGCSAPGFRAGLPRPPQGPRSRCRSSFPQ